MKKRYLPLVMSLFLLTGCSLGIQSTTQVEKVVTIADEVEVIQIKNTIADVYAQASKSCVGIFVEAETGSGNGSGVIYKYDASTQTYYVITNAHVVADCTKYSIYDGKDTYYQATLLGIDEKNDIAVLSFSTDILGEKREFVALDITKKPEDMVTIGQTALAIGCPLGLIDYYNSLTTGVVSTFSNQKITTDCALNPGNSGGGLFNMEGRLIGIVNSKTVWTTQSENGVTSQVPVEGKGYAIHMDVVRSCVKDIEELGGKIERPVFGMVVTSINQILGGETYEKYKECLPEGYDQNGYVLATSFVEDSRAKACGVEVGDVILKINGNIVTKNTDISDVLYIAHKTDTVTLTVYRSSEGKTIDIPVTWE